MVLRWAFYSAMIQKPMRHHNCYALRLQVSVKHSKKSFNVKQRHDGVNYLHNKDGILHFKEDSYVL